jgi:hypothetical protein
MSEEPEFRFFQEMYPADRCYLFEVLMWRAFGRIPSACYTDEAIDRRFDDDDRDSYHAPFPDLGCISEEECKFAGISNDPRNEEDSYYPDPSRYDRVIENPSKEATHAELDQIRAVRKLAEDFHARVKEWLIEYEEYIEQFMSEIFLGLRKGDLLAVGTACSLGGMEHAFDKWGDSSWPSVSDELAISKECWVLSAINWPDSALEGREKSFMWVYVETEQMLELFPPNPAGLSTPLMSSGDTYFTADITPAKKRSTAPRGGRPPLPWSDFSVEVTRMFRDGEMPKKQDAGITIMQDWFLKAHGKEVGRTAITQKLKPYYDKLIRKNQKPDNG